MAKRTKLNPFITARVGAGYRFQRDAARAAGIAQSALSALEAGFTNPTWDVLGRLIQIYRCRPEDLLPLPKLPRRGTHA